MPRGGTLSSLGDHFDPIAESARRAAQAVSEVREELDTARAQITQNTQQINSVVGTLQGGMDRLSEQVERVITSIKNLSSSSSQNRDEITRQAISVNKLYEAYEALGIGTKALAVNIRDLTFSQKEINKVVELGEDYSKRQVGSYNALADKYKMLKILLNNLTQEERNNTEAGKALVSMARSTYEEMNKLQQATGKFQLQVGDYSKSMTGLNIATQQVVRELPVLAQSAQMFVMAISNNIPILIDNIKYVKQANVSLEDSKKKLLEAAEAEEALGKAKEAAALRAEAAAMKATSVLNAMLKSLFSWQTAIVLVLTVLPKIIKNIQEKRKATDELANSTKDAVTYTQLMAEADRNAFSQQTKAISDLKTLYDITQDTNRSWEDRVKVAKAMKVEFKDELANIDAEAIAMGSAKTEIDNLTNSLVAQAKARAYLNEIESLSIKMYDLEIKRNDILAKQKTEQSALDLAITQRQAFYEKNAAFIDPMGETLNTATIRFAKLDAEVKKHEAEVEKLGSAYRNFDSQMQDVDNAIFELKKRISPDGLLLDLLGGRGRKGKEEILNIPDYFLEAFGKAVDMIPEGIDKTISEMDLEWTKLKKKYSEYRAGLLDLQEKADAEERAKIQKQLKYVEELEILAYTDYLNKKRKAWEEYFAQYTMEAEEEDFDEKTRKSLETRLKTEQKLRDAAAYQSYETAVNAKMDEIEAKKTLDQALLDSEREYWQTYLEELRKNGVLTIEEYNKIMEQLAKGGKVETTTDSSRRGRRGRRYGGVVEALLAQTETYGEKDKFGKQVVKEQYLDFVNAVDSALKSSMGYMEEWIATREKMAEAAVKAAEKEVEATKTALDYELQARANGYASNVEMAREEYEQRLALQRAALAEQQRLQKIQQAIDTASQISSLVTATANIWASYEKIPMGLGTPLALAATAMMWGSFAASKITAAQLANQKTYGDGGYEYMNYGGSHASGHDIDFGVTPDGRSRRVERGEMVGIINKRNVSKYGVGEIANIITSLNNGTFEDNYSLAFAGLQGMEAQEGVNLSGLEEGVRTLVQQGDRRVVVAGDKTIVYYKNTKRIIRN